MTGAEGQADALGGPGGWRVGITRCCLPSVLPDFGASTVTAVKDAASIQVEGVGLHGRD